MAIAVLESRPRSRLARGQRVEGAVWPLRSQVNGSFASGHCTLQAHHAAHARGVAGAAPPVLWWVGVAGGDGQVASGRLPPRPVTVVGIRASAGAARLVCVRRCVGARGRVVRRRGEVDRCPLLSG
jgi:hypothetical protein